MTYHDDSVYLHHVLDALATIEEFLGAVDEGQFRQSRLLQVGLIHELQIVGEAMRRVSPGIQARHPEVPWRQIIGMRNRLVHDYSNADLNAVWQAATIDAPALKPTIEAILAELRPSP